MNLHDNQKNFTDAVIEASSYFNISTSLVEKDYFVMLILRELNKEIPGLLFKGGTCCSHAYKVIDRFSEDIDLSLDSEHFGRNHNIEANKTVIKVCDRLGFKILNRDKVINHSHGNFNRYDIEYPILFPSNSIKPFVQIELTFYERSYPHEIKEVNTIIGDFLLDIYNDEGADAFNLMPFNICVQKLERTFIDKVFAICDYFESKAVIRNSRHIYDLYMIAGSINYKDPSFKELIANVRNDRKKNERCVSAKDGYNINQTLEKILETDFFKSDYNQNTRLLLSKDVAYVDAISVLKNIIKANIFE